MRNNWVCSTSLRSLARIKRLNVYGVSSRDKNIMGSFRKGDSLFLHVPSVGIVAYCMVISRLFERSRDKTQYDYPYAVKIKFVWDFAGNIAKAIPFLPSTRTDVVVEPLFTVRAIYPIADSQRDYYLKEIMPGRLRLD